MDSGLNYTPLLNELPEGEGGGGLVCALVAEGDLIKKQ